MARESDPWGYLPKTRNKAQLCFECGFITTGRHHVVPVSCGGTKVIPLCQDCHNKAHGDQAIRADLIRAGMKKKIEAGWKPGAPIKMTEEKTLVALGLRQTGWTYRRIAMLMGLSIGSIHKAINGVQSASSK